MTCPQPPSSDRYLEPYRQAVARYGPGFHATLWSTPEAQQLRFDVMIKLTRFEPDSVILDAGCGSGDLAARLLERQVAFHRYVGIDAIPEMIQQAQQRDLPRCTFQVMDLLHPVGPGNPASPGGMTLENPHYVCISGTLNTMDVPTARSLVQSAFEVARRGVVFNFLSTSHHPRWAQRDIGPARRFDPMDWLEWSLGLTCRVVFTQDYLDGHDATILLRRDAERGCSQGP